jgi:hypothetical protein
MVNSKSVSSRRGGQSGYSLLMRRALPGIPLACAALFWGACGAFDSANEAPADAGADTPPTPTDGPTGPPDGGDAGEGGEDGGTTVAAHAAPCPRPVGPQCNPESCTRRVLYQPAQPGIEFPYTITTDEAFVYWTTVSAETNGDVPYDGLGVAKIMRVDRGGVLMGSKATVIAEGQRRAHNLAAAGDYLYWVAMNVTGKAQLRRVRRDCAMACPIEPLVELGSSPVWELVEIDDKTLLAADDAADVYVVSVGVTPALVAATVKTSSYATVTASNTAGFAMGAFAPETKIVPLSTLTPVPHGFIPDAGEGSNLTAGMSPITTDCNDIFGWRNQKEVWKLGVAGGVATKFKTISTGDVFSLAADRSWLYVGSANAGGVLAVSIDGLVEQTIQGGNIHRIAVDGAGVYWGDHDAMTGGAIWMMLKK